MKKLLKCENGAEKVLLYIQMMLLSLENDGVMYFQHVENTFEEEISLQFDINENIARETMEYLIKHGLVEVDNDEYVFLQIDELTGNGKIKSTSRVRKHREKKSNDKNCNKEESECNADVTSCNAKENK